MALSKREFLEIYKRLPQEKKNYGLFYIDPKNGFATWDRVYAALLKEDKLSKLIRDRFVSGEYWKRKSCTEVPKEYKIEQRTGNTIMVCSDPVLDVVELGKLVDTYHPTDVPWQYEKKEPCHSGAGKEHYTFIRVYKHEGYN